MLSLYILGEKDLEAYMEKNDITCTQLQLRTKIMNEQNIRQRIKQKKMKELSS